MDQIVQWDKELFLYIHHLNSGKGDAFWLFVTQIEHWIPLYILFFIFFLKALSRKNGIIAILFTLVVLGFSLGLTTVVKNLVQRLRPSNSPELQDVIRVLETHTDFSFFSGHAAVSLSISVFVILVLKSHFKWIYGILVWPLFFISSRIFVAAHFPSDLFVGAIVGMLIGWSFYKMYNKATYS